MLGKFRVVAGLLVALSLVAVQRTTATHAQSQPPSLASPNPCSLSLQDAQNPLTVLHTCAASFGGTASAVAGGGSASCGTWQPGNMAAFAGGLGEGLNALDVPLWEPYGVAVDASGNVYVADAYNNRVRKIAPDGTITTVAGSGPVYAGGGGYCGDGGPAIHARLNFPSGVAVDSAGNVYIADTFNDVIRKVDTNGIITTVAGVGHGCVTLECQGLGDGGPATSATISNPFGVAVDRAENIYIADTSDERVRKVDASGTITTVAGNNHSGYTGDGGPATQAELWAPTNVAVDAQGNLYIADDGNNVIRKVDSSGIITTVAGTGQACGNATAACGDGGPATQAQLWGPYDISLDPAGNLYIADLIDFRIRKVDTSGIITTVAGTGNQHGLDRQGVPAASTDLLGVIGVAALSNGAFYFTDGLTLQYVDPSGILYRRAGNGHFHWIADGQPAWNEPLTEPGGVAAAGGNVYIADTSNQLIRKVDQSGNLHTLVGSAGEYGAPAWYCGDNGPATSACVNAPSGLAIDRAGDLYIADTQNDIVRKVDPSGIITTIAGIPPDCSAYPCKVRAGYTGDSGPATQAELNNPTAVAVDTAGNLYIADTNNDVIRKVSPAGIISTVAGNGGADCLSYTCVATGDGGPATSATLGYPSGLAIDSSGNLYIADTFDEVVRKVSASGIISTVAGNGIPAYSGDGGSATAASLWAPSAVAVDGRGNLFIADTVNARIRAVNTRGIINTIAGTGPQVQIGSQSAGYYGSYCGDSGPSTMLCTAKPVGLALDGSGNLYIADPNNWVIWKMELPPSYLLP